MREAVRPTVMVAHSDDDTRHLLRFWLETEGYSVVEAADGQAAVELACVRRPELLLMSDRMSKVGGLEAARRIRRQVKERVFPIVALSSYPTEEAQAAAVNAGCDSFVSQPVDFDFLSELLRRLLHGTACGHRASGLSAHAEIS